MAIYRLSVQGIRRSEGRSTIAAAAYRSGTQLRDERLSQALRPAGFDVPSLSSYSLSRCRPGLVLGYAAFDPKALRTHVVSLARALDRSLPLASGSLVPLVRSGKRH